MEITKAQAAQKMIDEISDIVLELKKAEYIIQEMTDEYFRKFHRDDKDDREEILWDFDRNATRAEIMWDALARINRIVRPLYNAALQKEVKTA